MRIGTDFDNTLVSYDALFYQLASERGLLTTEVAPNKTAVRNHLRRINQEAVWTELQGIAYGSRILEAIYYPDVLPTLQELHNGGDTLSIISHKTRKPFIGQPIDLHGAARNWLNQNQICANTGPVLPEHVFFEETLENKLARIAASQCEVFIDDLPEVLLHPKFPEHTKQILFDPAAQHTTFPGQSIQKWSQLPKVLSQL